MHSIYHREKSIKPNPIEYWKSGKNYKQTFKQAKKYPILYTSVTAAAAAAAVACKFNIFYRLCGISCTHVFGCISSYHSFRLQIPKPALCARRCLIYFHPWISRACGNLHTHTIHSECACIYIYIFELKLWIICAHRNGTTSG